MNQILTAGMLTGLVIAGIAAPETGAQDLQAKVAAAKDAAAKNQQALHQYSWIEKTEISVKGEVKNTKIESCRYGPDGKVQKTQLSEPPPPQKKQRGLRGKMIEKKTAEMKEDMQAAGALVQQYVPPSGEKIQAALAAGKVSITPGGAGTALRISDYAKVGDALTLTLDAAGKGMQGMAVDSWLEEPDEKVTLKVQMVSLPDGTSHPSTILMSVPHDNIDVKITKSNYQKLAQ